MISKFLDQLYNDCNVAQAMADAADSQMTKTEEAIDESAERK